MAFRGAHVFLGLLGERECGELTALVTEHQGTVVREEEEGISGDTIFILPDPPAHLHPARLSLLAQAAGSVNVATCSQLRADAAAGRLCTGRPPSDDQISLIFSAFWTSFRAEHSRDAVPKIFLLGARAVTFDVQGKRGDRHRQVSEVIEMCGGKVRQRGTAGVEAASVSDVGGGGSGGGAREKYGPDVDVVVVLSRSAVAQVKLHVAQAVARASKAVPTSGLGGSSPAPAAGVSAVPPAATAPRHRDSPPSTTMMTPASFPSALAPAAASSAIPTGNLSASTFVTASFHSTVPTLARFVTTTTAAHSPTSGPSTPVNLMPAPDDTVEIAPLPSSFPISAHPLLPTSTSSLPVRVQTPSTLALAPPPIHVMAAVDVFLLVASGSGVASSPDLLRVLTARGFKVPRPSSILPPPGSNGLASKRQPPSSSESGKLAALALPRTAFSRPQGVPTFRPLLPLSRQKILAASGIDLTSLVVGEALLASANFSEAFPSWHVLSPVTQSRIMRITTLAFAEAVLVHPTEDWPTRVDLPTLLRVHAPLLLDDLEGCIKAYARRLCAGVCATLEAAMASLQVTVLVIDPPGLLIRGHLSNKFLQQERIALMSTLALELPYLPTAKLLASAVAAVAGNASEKSVGGSCLGEAAMETGSTEPFYADKRGSSSIVRSPGPSAAEAETSDDVDHAMLISVVLERIKANGVTVEEMGDVLLLTSCGAVRDAGKMLELQSNILQRCSWLRKGFSKLPGTADGGAKGGDGRGTQTNGLHGKRRHVGLAIDSASAAQRQGHAGENGVRVQDQLRAQLLVIPREAANLTFVKAFWRRAQSHPRRLFVLVCEEADGDVAFCASEPRAGEMQEISFPSGHSHATSSSSSAGGGGSGAGAMSSAAAAGGGGGGGSRSSSHGSSFHSGGSQGSRSVTSGGITSRGHQSSNLRMGLAYSMLFGSGLAASTPNVIVLLSSAAPFVLAGGGSRRGKPPTATVDGATSTTAVVGTTPSLTSSHLQGHALLPRLLCTHPTFEQYATWAIHVRQTARVTVDSVFEGQLSRECGNYSQGGLLLRPYPCLRNSADVLLESYAVALAHIASSPPLGATFAHNGADPRASAVAYSLTPIAANTEKLLRYLLSLREDSLLLRDHNLNGCLLIRTPCIQSAALLAKGLQEIVLLLTAKLPCPLEVLHWQDDDLPSNLDSAVILVRGGPATYRRWLAGSSPTRTRYSETTAGGGGGPRVDYKSPSAVVVGLDWRALRYSMTVAEELKEYSWVWCSEKEGDGASRLKSVMILTSGDFRAPSAEQSQQLDLRVVANHPRVGSSWDQQSAMTDEAPPHLSTTPTSSASSASSSRTQSPFAAWWCDPQPQPTGNHFDLVASRFGPKQAIQVLMAHGPQISGTTAVLGLLDALQAKLNEKAGAVRFDVAVFDDEVAKATGVGRQQQSTRISARSAATRSTPLFQPGAGLSTPASAAAAAAAAAASSPLLSANSPLPEDCRRLGGIGVGVSSGGGGGVGGGGLGLGPIEGRYETLLPNLHFLRPAPGILRAVVGFGYRVSLRPGPFCLQYIADDTESTATTKVATTTATTTATSKGAPAASASSNLYNMQQTMIPQTLAGRCDDPGTWRIPASKLHFFLALSESGSMNIDANSIPLDSKSGCRMPIVFVLPSSSGQRGCVSAPRHAPRHDSQHLYTHPHQRAFEELEPLVVFVVYEKDAQEEQAGRSSHMSDSIVCILPPSLDDMGPAAARDWVCRLVASMSDEHSWPWVILLDDAVVKFVSDEGNGHGQEAQQGDEENLEPEEDEEREGAGRAGSGGGVRGWDSSAKEKKKEKEGEREAGKMRIKSETVDEEDEEAIEASSLQRGCARRVQDMMAGLRDVPLRQFVEKLWAVTRVEDERRQAELKRDSFSDFLGWTGDRDYYDGGGGGGGGGDGGGGGGGGVGSGNGGGVAFQSDGIGGGKIGAEGGEFSNGPLTKKPKMMTTEVHEDRIERADGRAAMGSGGGVGVFGGVGSFGGFDGQHDETSGNGLGRMEVDGSRDGFDDREPLRQLDGAGGVGRQASEEDGVGISKRSASVVGCSPFYLVKPPNALGDEGWMADEFLGDVDLFETRIAPHACLALNMRQREWASAAYSLGDGPWADGRFCQRVEKVGGRVEVLESLMCITLAGPGTSDNVKLEGSVGNTATASKSTLGTAAIAAVGDGGGAGESTPASTAFGAKKEAEDVSVAVGKNSAQRSPSSAVIDLLPGRQQGIGSPERSATCLRLVNNHDPTLLFRSVQVSDRMDERALSMHQALPDSYVLGAVDGEFAGVVAPHWPYPIELEVEVVKLLSWPTSSAPHLPGDVETEEKSSAGGAESAPKAHPVSAAAIAHPGDVSMIPPHHNTGASTSASTGIVPTESTLAPLSASVAATSTEPVPFTMGGISAVIPEASVGSTQQLGPAVVSGASVATSTTAATITPLLSTPYQPPLPMSSGNAFASIPQSLNRSMLPSACLLRMLPHDRGTAVLCLLGGSASSPEDSSGANGDSDEEEEDEDEDPLVTAVTSALANADSSSTSFSTIGLALDKNTMDDVGAGGPATKGKRKMAAKKKKKVSAAKQLVRGCEVKGVTKRTLQQELERRRSRGMKLVLVDSGREPSGSMMEAALAQLAHVPVQKRRQHNAGGTAVPTRIVQLLLLLPVSQARQPSFKSALTIFTFVHAVEAREAWCCCGGTADGCAGWTLLSLWMQ